MQADTAGGASTGLQNLEAAVSMHVQEKDDASNKLSVSERLKQWAPAIEHWLAGEAQSPLRTDSPLKVSLHSSFGKLKASVLYSSCSCRCGRGLAKEGDSCKDGDIKSCTIHSDQVVLSDLVFEIAKQVHEVFNDQFIAFANLLAEETVSGHGVCVARVLSRVAISKTSSGKLANHT